MHLKKNNIGQGSHVRPVAGQKNPSIGAKDRVEPTFAQAKKCDPASEYAMDLLTVGPNLAGIPHASVPIGEKGNLPYGAMLSMNHFQDEKLISFMESRGGAYNA